jgi:CheY-like chemotaxis protein
LPSPNTRKRNKVIQFPYPSSFSHAECQILTSDLNSAINRRIAIKTIRKLGFANVAAANDGRQALDYLTNVKNTVPPTVPPTVILMDVQMPVMDGYDATYKLRHEEPFVSDNDLRDVPVVALTASAIQGDREKCFEKGMSDYLSKPFSTEALDRMIVKWAVKRRNERDKSRTKS